MIVEAEDQDSLERGMRGLNDLFNAARHCEKAGKPAPRSAIDPRSSAPRFTGWRTPLAEPTTRDLGTSPPRTWLLRIGWKRHGLLADDD
jgi:hypothetical protein